VCLSATLGRPVAVNDVVDGGHDDIAFSINGSGGSQ
jgi:hypothetical protein